jgi:FlaA1/EpsC-like NDP-sugar epimerase
MRSILKACLKFLPLFLSVICLLYLVLALVPGRLEDHLNNLNIFLSLFLSIAQLLLYFSMLALAIYEIVRIFQRKQSIKNIWQLSGILSFLIMTITAYLLSQDIPARLYFATSESQFQQVLARQVTDGFQSNGIKEIGNFKVSDVMVDSDASSPKIKSVYFVTRNVADWIDMDRYGFAYLPDRTKTFATQTRHLHGNWYIFYQKGN